MIKSLICSVSGHTVNRKRVWHDGRSYRTKCQNCGKPLLRDLAGWREFDFDGDLKDGRAPHPVTGEVA